MKISEKYKVRDMAGQHVVIIQGKYGEDMTKIISLNESSLFLWNKFMGKEFSSGDVARALIDRYSIDEGTAERDASHWCEKLVQSGLVENG